MWPFSSPYPALSAEELGRSNASFDYIVVGGGTAGCCLAARLSEDPAVKVLLIDRGIVGDTWTSRVPLISSNLYRDGAPAAVWPVSPLENANNRVVHAVVGEGLGGGSRINSVVYTRGIGDYNLWRDMGHPTWSYNELEPYFTKSEHTLSQPASRFRGKTGPWINQIFPTPNFDILRHVNQAAKAIGIPLIPDLNNPAAPVVCCSTLDVMVDSSMRRMSTFDTFLPAKVALTRKSNLVICANTIVTRLLLKSDDGKPRAAGVYFEATSLKADSRNYVLDARKEVILCAGAIASPQILMLSGIGPKSHLESHGIAVVKDLPGVGSHLKDHPGLPVHYQVPLDDTLHVLKNKPLRAISELLKYVALGKGLLAYPFMQSSIFVRSALLNSNMEIVVHDPSDLDAQLPTNTPDIEIMPVAHRCTEGESDPWDALGVFAFLTCLVKPKSYGTVRLASADPHTRATITLGYLNDLEDMVVLRTAVRLALRLAEQVRAQGYPLKDLRVPLSESEADLDKFIRENVRTSYHYSSTCRMASEHDPIHPGVVDDELRVHGVAGLRVCDTSIFPEILSTHTMAGAVVVAEKCADLIKRTAKV